MLKVRKRHQLKMTYLLYIASILSCIYILTFVLYPEKPRFKTSALREQREDKRLAQPKRTSSIPNPYSVIESPNKRMEGRTLNESESLLICYYSSTGKESKMWKFKMQNGKFCIPSSSLLFFPLLSPFSFQYYVSFLSSRFREAKLESSEQDFQDRTYSANLDFRASWQKIPKYFMYL